MPVTDQPGAPNEACAHPVARHCHGTYVCFTQDRCRCDECRGANRRYEAHRKSWTSEFPWRPQPLVDAEPVAAHARALMAQGMGMKRIGKVAGVAQSAIGNIVYGRNGANARPATKMRRATAERILAVNLDLADGAQVDAAEARAIITELTARGWSRAEIGRRVHGPGARTLQVAHRGQTQVFAGTLRALRTLLYEEVPLRVHGPTGKLYRPNPGYQPRIIPASTPGVPEEPMPRDYWLKIMRKGLWEAVRQGMETHGRRTDLLETIRARRAS